MLMSSLQSMALNWGKAAGMTVYVQDILSEKEIETTREHIQGLLGVKQATIVSSEEALARFRNRGTQIAALLEGIDASVLPPSIDIILQSDLVELAAIQNLAAAIQEIPGVEEVDYGKTDFDNLRDFLRVLKAVALVVSALLLFVTVMIVANTLRLVVLGRHDELTVMKWVGATPLLIRGPFMLEGGVWGMLAGAVAALLLWSGERLFGPALEQMLQQWLGAANILTLTPLLAVQLMALGILLGLVGSGVAVRRYGRVDEI